MINMVPYVSIYHETNVKIDSIYPYSKSKNQM